MHVETTLKHSSRNIGRNAFERLDESLRFTLAGGCEMIQRHRMLSKIYRMETRLHALRTLKCERIASTDQRDDLIRKKDTKIIEIHDGLPDLRHRIVRLFYSSFPEKKTVDEHFDGITAIGGRPR